MKEILKSHGLRLTPQRIEILRTLEKLGSKHPSFSQICEAVKIRHTNVSRSTILENLNELVGIGLMTSFSFDGETHYEMNPQPHVNLVGPNGTILDINDEEIVQLLTRLLGLIKTKTGAQVRSLLVLAE